MGTSIVLTRDGYVFPHQAYERVTDQFMLGNQILVASVLEKESNKRKVIFPKGDWMGFDGMRYQGPKTISVDVPYVKLFC